MVNIPQLTGLFDPVPYKAPQNATENNLSTIAALSDPSGTLQRMQADQILKTVANVKMEGVDLKYKQHALNAINEYKEYTKSLYNKNKGFNRLSLSADQKLLEDQKYRELLMNVNGLKELSETNKKTLMDVDDAFSKQIITPAEYAAFNKKITEMEDAAKTIGDVPNYRAIWNNFLSQRPQKPVVDPFNLQEIEKIYAPAVIAISKRDYKNPTPAQAKEFIDKEYPIGGQAWNYIKAEMIKQNKISPLTPDADARELYAQGISDRARGKDVPSSVVFGGGGNKKDPIPIEMENGMFPMGAYNIRANTDEGAAHITQIAPVGDKWMVSATITKPGMLGKSEIVQKYFVLDESLINSMEKKGYDVTELRQAYKNPPKAEPEPVVETKRAVLVSPDGVEYNSLMVQQKWEERNGRKPTADEWQKFLKEKKLKVKK